MKAKFILLGLLILSGFVNAGEVKIKVHFDKPTISREAQGDFISINGLSMAGEAGTPALPWKSLSLLLPAGEEAVSIEVKPGSEAGRFSGLDITPMQPSRPLSQGLSGEWARNEAIYASNTMLPTVMNGHFSTHFLYGHSIMMTTVCPVQYNPVKREVIWYDNLEIIVKTKPSERAGQALTLLRNGKEVESLLKRITENYNESATYAKSVTVADNKLLIVTPSEYMDGFADLVSYYANSGLEVSLVSFEDAINGQAGVDDAQKLRNYLISRYNNDGILYVLLGGDVELIPARGFYCKVQSSSLYEDSTIPSDLYYSSLDGTWNDNDNDLWGEIGEDDLLPELAVARLPFRSLTEQSHMTAKVLKYQQSPVLNETNWVLMAGEKLYDNPETYGQDYLELLVGERSDNGYTTTGLPENMNFFKLYDEGFNQWGSSDIIAKINDGYTFIQHSGHSNWDYMMRLSVWDITDENFSKVDGIQHNYAIIYSHGCICGAFDYPACIAEQTLKISKFAVAACVNSRYGWFNEGQTEGPSAHLHREWMNALYTLDSDRIGETQRLSKVATAPWVNAPGQWEEGALRWCFYDNNILGDPAMKINKGTSVGINTLTQSNELQVYPVPATDQVRISFDRPLNGSGILKILDMQGRLIYSESLHSEKNSIFEATLDLKYQGIKSGLYLLQLEASGNIITGKLLVR